MSSYGRCGRGMMVPLVSSSGAIVMAGGADGATEISSLVARLPLEFGKERQPLITTNSGDGLWRTGRSCGLGEGQMRYRLRGPAGAGRGGRCGGKAAVSAAVFAPLVRSVVGGDGAGPLAQGGEVGAVQAGGAEPPGDFRWSGEVVSAGAALQGAL